MYCGYCGKQGHNRRSCDHLKKTIKENPDGYYAQAARKKERNKKPRKCSYCSNVGHTKRTCSALEADRKTVAIKSRQWRAKFLSKAKDHGFGIGTLVKFDLETHSAIKSSWSYQRMTKTMEKHGAYAIVIDLRWDQLDHRQLNRSQYSMIIRFPDGYTISAMLPCDLSDVLDELARPRFKIAGRINSHDIGLSQPPEWHSGHDSTKYHLHVF